MNHQVKASANLTNISNWTPQEGRNFFDSEPVVKDFIWQFVLIINKFSSYMIDISRFKSS